MIADLSYRLAIGDCLAVLPTLEAESVHAVVTDPPYGIEFMNHKWDAWDRRVRSPNERAAISKGLSAYVAGKSFEEWCRSWARELYRVLKPGAFLFSFGSPRTFHRLGCGIEDAGFEIKDTFIWGYDSGFPKAQNAENLIAKRAGPELAKRWSGWKTPALKPAWEPIVVARKPFEGTLSQNLLTNEVGAFNIDEARLPFDGPSDLDVAAKAFERPHTESEKRTNGGYETTERARGPLGRYPSNVLLTDDLFADGRSKYYYFPKAGAERENDASGVEIQGERKQMGLLGKSALGERFWSEKKNVHPTVKPVELIERLIKLATRPGQTVLDPFVGSGTTLLAAKRTGRSAIGVELSAEYCAIAKERFGPTLGAPLEFIEPKIEVEKNV